MRKARRIGPARGGSEACYAGADGVEILRELAIEQSTFDAALGRDPKAFTNPS